MESAISIFARSGFDRATVDEIVREAGFSKGAFYVHFESKDDLFWEMLEDRITRQLESFRGAVDHAKPISHNVRTILDAVFDLAQEDPLWLPLFLEFSAHAARNDRVRRRLATVYDRWRDLIVGILSVSQEAGRMREDIDVRFISTVLIAAVEGCMIQAHVSPEKVSLKDIAEPLANTLSEWLVPETD